MSRTADVLGPSGEGNRAMFAMAPREETAGARRIITAEQLIAHACGVVLPGLNDVPTEHRFLADDRETIRLAEILVTLSIGAVEDWSQSQRDPTKYVVLTLQQWLHDHGGAAIDRRFDLDVTLSDRLVDYSDVRGPDGCGDDGTTEEVKCYDSEWYAWGEHEPVKHDASYLQEHFEELVPFGYENDCGGFGDVVLDVNARKLTVERNDRFEDYTTTTYEV